MPRGSTQKRTRKRTGNKKEDIVKAVDRSLVLLSCYLDSDSERLGVTELSNRVGLHKNNVFRVLATLEFKGYVEQTRRTEAYTLGPKILELGLIFKYQVGLIKPARPVMERIAREYNETVYLGVLRDVYAIYIEEVRSTRSVQVVSRIGSRIPAYATAIGKVQMAFLPREEIDRLLGENEITPFTGNTICEPTALKEHLSQIAEQQYALDIEEFQDDVRCVAAPIRDYTKMVVAGLSISAPKDRMSEERMEELSQAVREGALEISHNLGYIT